MNLFLRMLLTLVIFAIVGGISFYAYLGGFSKVVVREEQLGPFSIVYKHATGNEMSEVGVISEQLATDLKEGGFRSYRPFDVYFPDGHAEIGFVVGVLEAAKLSVLGDKYRLNYIPAGRFMTTAFPWKMKLSYVVGFMKVDAAFETYREKKGYVKTWAASRHDGTAITYLQPIEPKLIAPE